MIDYKVVQNADGTEETITWLEYCKRQMQKTLDRVVYEQQQNNERKKPLQLSFNNRIFSSLMQIFLQEQHLSNEEALCLSADQIRAALLDFTSLIGWINETVDYVPSKQLFAAFTGITISAYNDLLASDNKDVSEQMQIVEDYIVGHNVEGAKDRAVDPGMTRFYLSTNEQGHGVTKASNLEQAIKEATPLLAPLTVLNQFAAIQERNGLKLTSGNKKKKT